MREVEKSHPIAARNGSGTMQDPLAEGIRKRRTRFTGSQKESLKRQRKSLMAAGMTDSRIARILAPRFNTTKASLDDMFRRMISNGELEENPNKLVPLSESEMQRIRAMRERLMGEGLNDKGISKEVERKHGLEKSAVYHKIRQLVRQGELPPNPNKAIKMRFTAKDLMHLKRRREELMGEGKSDNAIGEIVAKELGRKVAPTRQKIRNMVNAGKLRRNPNHHLWRRFTKEELEGPRGELMRQGLNDISIAKSISPEEADAVYQRILRLVASGELEANPNNIRKFPPHSVRKVLRRSGGLVSLGLSFAAAARILSRELGMEEGSLSNLMSGFRREGLLENNYDRKMSAEWERLITRREALIEKGKTDDQAARAISRERGLRFDTVKLLFFRMMRMGGCRSNPNG